jgi:hypothetical protein
MADLYLLPDGRRVRRGSDFSLPTKRTRIEAAIIGTDKAGNQFVEKPPYATTDVGAKYFPSNWLHVATPAMLKAEGIEPIEEDRDADQRFYHVGEGPIKKGRLTKIAKPRAIKDIQAMLLREVKDQARGHILSRFSLEKQATMQRRLANTETSVAERKKIIDGFVWIDDVLTHCDKLEAQIARLGNAQAAEKWAAKPRAWPKNPDVKEV